MDDTLLPRKTAVLYDDLWDRLDTQAFAFARAESEAYFPLDGQWVRGRRCMDAGCGVGFFPQRLLDAGAAHVVAIDIGEENCRNTLRWNQAHHDRLTVRQESVLAIREPDASFGFVHSNGVLHHTENPEQGFRELVRVTEPGGRIVVGLYGAGGLFPLFLNTLRVIVRFFPYTWVSRIVSAIYRKPYDQYLILDFLFVPIQHRYREAEARAWFARAGLADVKRHPFHARYRVGSFWARLLHGDGYLTISGIKP